MMEDIPEMLESYIDSKGLILDEKSFRLIPQSTNKKHKATKND